MEAGKEGNGGIGTVENKKTTETTVVREAIDSPGSISYYITNNSQQVYIYSCYC